jgi:hypothetical protein
MSHRSVWLGLGALAIFAGLFYFYGGHQTPSGQAPLADLNAANLTELKNEFNDSHANVRMLVLLSPTWPVCVRGASALESLLETQTESHLRVFVIWEPVLATDLSAPSTITLRRIHDARVKQYWDRNRVLSHAMGEHDRPSVVWDYIAVYKPEQIWTDVPLQPEFTGRPVVRFIEGTRRALNTIYSEQKKWTDGRTSQKWMKPLSE